MIVIDQSKPENKQSPQQLSSEIVRTKVESLYELSCLGAPIRVIGGSTESAVWQLKTNRGNWLVKVFKVSKWLSGHVADEANLYAYLNQHGIRAPKVLHSRRRRRSEEIEVAMHRYPIIVMELEDLRFTEPASIPGVVLGCTDCHGGDAKVAKPAGAERKDAAYQAALERSHVLPRYPLAWNWPSSANPEGSYTLLNREAPEQIRFVNPGDLRVAREACGACHLAIIQASERSLMATSAMLWCGAAYNNGILPFKRYILGGASTREGVGATLLNPVKPTDFLVAKGILPSVTALPSWETIPPADVDSREEIAVLSDPFAHAPAAFRPARRRLSRTC